MPNGMMLRKLTSMRLMMRTTTTETMMLSKRTVLRLRTKVLKEVKALTTTARRTRSRRKS